MLTDETINEDLEALLYAQVFYGKSDDLIENIDDELNPPINERGVVDSDKSEDIINDINVHKQIYRKRYFDNHLTGNLDGLCNIDSNSSLGQDFHGNSIAKGQNIIQNSNAVNKTQSCFEITTPLNQEQDDENSSKHISEICQPSFLNNITVNQYTYPEFQKKLEYFTQNLPWTKICKRDLRNLQKGTLSEDKFFKILQKRLDAHQLRIKRDRLEKTAESEIICLSSEDSDIEIVDINVIPKITEKTIVDTDNTSINKMEEKDVNGSDDEIIYIAPPPVPVINLDESDSETVDPGNDNQVSVKNAQKLPQDIDDASNDFLGNETNCSTENFNFSLHGSEFQNSDFVRPANPTDVYETESSTSTSEFNKDSSRNFSNTVKTIVFNEVEFPKEDVFTENNLESFGEMITPKRPSSNSPLEEVTTCSDKTKKVSSRVMSESSSESDYDTSNVHSNLPALTPINAENLSRNKNSKQLSNTETLAQNDKKKGLKRNSGQMESPGTSKAKVKKKKRMSKIHDKNDDIENNISKSNSIKDNKQVWEVSASSTPKKKQICNSDMKVKKKKKLSKNSTMDDSSNISLSKGDMNKKGKKKKKIDKTKSSTPIKTGDKNGDQTENNQDSLLDCSTDIQSEAEIFQEVEAIENTTINMQETSKNSSRRKNKKKKSKQSNNMTSAISCGMQVLQRPQNLIERSDCDLTNCSKETSKNDCTQDGPDTSKESNNISDCKGNIEQIDSSNKKRNKKRRLKISESNMATEHISENSVNDTNCDNIAEVTKDAILETKEETCVTIIPKSNDNVSGDADKMNNKAKSQKPSNKCTNFTEGCDNVKELYTSDQSAIRNNENDDVAKQSDKLINIDEAAGCLSETNIKNTYSKSRQTSNKPPDFTEEFNSIKEICASNQTEMTNNEKNDIEAESDEFIIIDEVGHSATNEEIVVISSSDSDEDIQSFQGIGNMLQLANTSKGNQNSVVDGNFSKFNVDVLQNKMSDDPSKWEIISSDKHRIPVYASGPRCNKCRQRGHFALKCPNKPSLPNCSLCGHAGHYEPRCPNQCGNPGHFSTVFCWKCVKDRKATCHICMIYGHTSDQCPDLWRRYHLTTREGPLVTPKYKQAWQPRHKQWCSGCASQGHLEFECDSYRWNREYPATSPQIFKYKNVYPMRNQAGSPRKKNINKEHTNIIESENTVHEQSLDNKVNQSVTDSYPNDTVNECISNHAPNSVDLISDVDKSKLNCLIPPKNAINQNLASLSPQNTNRNVKNSKINPLSIMNNQQLLQSAYRPYESVLNPCSLFNSFTPTTDLYQHVPSSLIRNQLTSGELNDNLDVQVPGYIIETNPTFEKAPVNIQSTKHFSTDHKLYNLEQSILKKFNSFSQQAMKQFLSSELDKLNILDLDAKVYKKKLHIIDNLNRIAVKNQTIEKQIYHLYKKVNMFLFGVSLICDGKRHLDYLRNFLYNCESEPLKTPKRKSLLGAYSYIFGGQHRNFNYRHYMNNIILKKHKK